MFSTVILCSEGKGKPMGMPGSNKSRLGSTKPVVKPDTNTMFEPRSSPIASRTPITKVAISSRTPIADVPTYLLAPGCSPVGAPVPKGTPTRAAMKHIGCHEPQQTPIYGAAITPNNPVMPATFENHMQLLEDFWNLLLQLQRPKTIIIHNMQA